MATNKRTEEAKPADNCMRIRDVVETWVSENQEPKHIAVAGKSYGDFIRSCYQFLLVHALRHGASSTDVLVDSEDRQQIEMFLKRCKVLWDQRRKEEMDKAEAQRLIESQRQAEEARRIEMLHKSEQKRQAKLLQEDNRRLEEAKRQAEDRRRYGEQRAIDKRRRQEEQVKLATSKNEQTRINNIYAMHQDAVANEGIRLQAGQCTWTDYYSFILHDRIERSAEILFGSSQQPSYELLQKNPELLENLKELSFGDNRHPNGYRNPYVSAYYTLRYELGYAFEYSQIYEMLLDMMRQNNEAPLLDVLSIGSGQGLDYWGLCYALSKQRTNWPRIAWQGVDLEKWPDHIIDDGLAQYSDSTDVLKLLGTMQSLDVKVLMFPKVISELTAEIIASIASWLEHVAFTRDVHYLCFAHTERRSLNPSDARHRGPKEFFHGVNESSLDAVKSAGLISAACSSAQRQSYSAELEWCNPAVMSVGHYSVAWPNAQTGGEWLCQYPYLMYNGDTDGKDWYVWKDDSTFLLDERLRRTVKGIGSSCCPRYMPSQDLDYGGRETECNLSRAGCNNSYPCPLVKYPRYKSGRIAYQIVRLVKQCEAYDDDIPF